MLSMNMHPSFLSTVSRRLSTLISDLDIGPILKTPHFIVSRLDLVPGRDSGVSSTSQCGILFFLLVTQSVNDSFSLIHLQFRFVCWFLCDGLQRLSADSSFDCAFFGRSQNLLGSSFMLLILHFVLVQHAEVDFF